MKRKIISLILTAALLLAIVPQFGTIAFADAAPEFSDFSLVLENNITVRFYANADELTANGYTEPQVRFGFLGGTTVETEYTEKDGMICFAFHGVAAKEMATPISATLTAKKGGDRVEGETVVTSVREYCLSALSLFPEDDDLCTMIVNLLVYGAKSQIYFDYNTGDLATDGLSVAQLGMATEDAPSLTDGTNPTYRLAEEETVTWYGANVLLGDAVTLQLFFSAPTTANLAVALKDESGMTLARFTSGDFEPRGGYYCISYAGLCAHELRKLVFATATYTDSLAEESDELPILLAATVASNTLRYSVESYCCGANERGEANLTALIEAMMKYSDSAETYRHPKERTRQMVEAYFEGFDTEVYYVGATRSYTSFVTLLPGVSLGRDMYPGASCGRFSAGSGHRAGSAWLLP